MTYIHGIVDKADKLVTMRCQLDKCQVGRQQINVLQVAVRRPMYQLSCSIYSAVFAVFTNVFFALYSTVCRLHSELYAISRPSVCPSHAWISHKKPICRSDSQPYCLTADYLVISDCC